MKGTGVYHEGELGVQARAGVADMAARVGRGIREEIPPAGAAFLEELRFVVIGRADAHGRAWASMLVGKPGFVYPAGPRLLAVDARPPDGDPLAGALSTAGALGLLAIDLATRRRMRVNGSAEPSSGGVVVRTDQVYSNCPKYIQARDVEPAAPAAARPVPARSETLSASQRTLVARADTFFVATYHESAGADASHRGGMPGVVRVESPTRVSWDDYPGNAMFQTLGNVASNGRIGLLFVDFDSGTTLQLSGTAQVVWSDTRRVEVDIERVVETSGVLPLRWRFLSPSPFNPDETVR